MQSTSPSLLSSILVSGLAICMILSLFSHEPGMERPLLSTLDFPARPDSTTTGRERLQQAHHLL